MQRLVQWLILLYDHPKWNSDWHLWNSAECNPIGMYARRWTARWTVDLSTKMDWYMPVHFCLPMTPVMGVYVNLHV